MALVLSKTIAVFVEEAELLKALVIVPETFLTSVAYVVALAFLSATVIAMET